MHVLTSVRDRLLKLTKKRTQLSGAWRSSETVGLSSIPCSYWLPIDASSVGGCDVDKAYAGPKLSVDADGKYIITLEFVRAMMEWFKDGKALPRRWVECDSMLSSYVGIDIAKVCMGDCTRCSWTLRQGRNFGYPQRGRWHDVWCYWWRSRYVSVLTNTQSGNFIL